MIDWKAQWEAHGRNFRDGYVHVDLREFGGDGEVKLAPGPGFGDLSHPTTRLVLKMMALHIRGKKVLDIGCGSGVLSLAAGALGADSVYGIDIEPDAVEHANANTVVNQQEQIVQFGLPGTFSPSKGELVILMNMIRTEQKQAWESVQPLTGVHGSVFSSGVLAEEREIYLEQCAHWGWTVQEVLEEDGWLGFQFKF